jgi:hypothetical protein
MRRHGGPKDKQVSLFITARTEQLEQDRQKGTAKTEQLEQDRQKGTARTGQPEKDRQNRTASRGLSGKDLLGQSEQDSQKRNTRKVLPAQDVRTGLLGPGSLSRTAWTGQPGQDSRTR